MKQKLRFVLFFCAFLAFKVQAATIYVDASATGANTGVSWTDAYNDLQTAITASANGDEIWVAAGVYKPTRDELGAIPTNPRAVVFYFDKDISIYGGFAGGETAIGQRPVWDTINGTVLSGDIGVVGSYPDNAYRVCWGVNLPATFRLDRLTIFGGYSVNDFLDGAAFLNDGSGTGNSSNPLFSEVYFKGNLSGNGGSCYNIGMNGGDASPTYRDCIFRDNIGEVGGAMQNNGDGGVSSPTIADCYFINNGAGEGGALYNIGYAGVSSPIITNTEFIDNSTITDGGAIFNDGALGIAAGSCSGCRFINNDADGNGGAVLTGGFSGNGNMTFLNCEFRGNQVTGRGGALFNDASSPTIDGCLFQGNQAQQRGGAIFNNGSQNTNSSPQILRSEFRQNASGDDGGAVFCDGLAGNCAPYFENVKFISNTATDGGGAIFADGSIGLTTPQFYNCMFSRNLAPLGGAVHTLANAGIARPLFINCSFSRNVATNQGAVFYLQEMNGGNLICDTRNMASHGQNGIVVSRQGANASLLIENSIFEQNMITNGGTCTIGCQSNVDPLFNDPINHDLTLQQGSPAIDVGTNSYNPTPFELGGGLRIQNNTIDLGAYERDPNNCPERIYVDMDATGADDGTSWANAFNSLHDGIQQAKLCMVDTIWVAEGFYYPSHSPNGTAPTPGNRNNTFYIPCDLVILGGFNATETAEPQRNPGLHLTTLSGDIGAAGYDQDNCYHVVTTTNVTNAMVLDGFTITKGYADVAPSDRGGGLLCEASGVGAFNSPTLRQLIFEDNFATFGGGLLVRATNNAVCDPDIRNCEFNNNSQTGALFQSTNGGLIDLTVRNCSFNNNGVSGTQGQVFFSGGMRLRYRNCDFTGNSNFDGGAIYFSANSHTVAEFEVRNSTFTSNTASRGGAIEFAANAQTTATFLVDGCTFLTNSVTGSGAGGAVSVFQGGAATFTSSIIRNSTFTSNSGSHGGAISQERHQNATMDFLVDNCQFTSNSSSFQGGAFYTRYASQIIRNSIFTSNSAPNGGALFIWSQSPHTQIPVIYNCEFRTNSATQGGGAMHFINYGAPILPRVTNCVFVQNTAAHGGGIYNSAFGNLAQASGNFVNCSFSRNSASNSGGAIFNDAWGSGSVATPNIINCSFSLNSTTSGTQGGALYNNNLFGNAHSISENCIYWDNQDEVSNNATFCTVDNSIFQGTVPFGIFGTTQLNQNPQYLAPALDDLRLAGGSPAINAGVNTFMPVDVDDVDADANTTENIDVDLALNARIQAVTIDLGALEGAATPLAQPEAWETLASKVYPTVVGSFETLYIERDAANVTQVQVFNGEGKRMLEKRISGRTARIETGDWARGMYLVKVGADVHRVAKAD